MTALSAQSARIPIGYIDNGNARVSVFITQEWLKYLSVQLFERVGGATSPTNGELVVDLPDDAGLEELKQEITRLSNTFQQAPSGAFLIVSAHEMERLSSIEATLQQLASRVSGLEQGLSL